MVVLKNEKGIIITSSRSPSINQYLCSTYRFRFPKLVNVNITSSQQSVNFPSIMSSVQRSLRGMRSLPNMRQLHSSSSTPKPSHLLSTAPSPYAAQTVMSLRGECKKRGLRQSGRKSDLVDRLVTHDASFKQFSTSRPREAKGDKSHIDFYKLPKAPSAPEDRGVQKFTIPIPPDAKYKAKEVLKSTESQSTSPQVEAQSGIHVVSGDADVSAMNAEVGDSTHALGTENTIPAKDKPFLYGLGAAVVAWWSSQWFGSEEK